MRQGGLAQPRRAKNQHMVQGLAQLPGCFDEDFHLFTDTGLANKFIQPGRSQAALETLLG